MFIFIVSIPDGKVGVAAHIPAVFSDENRTVLTVFGTVAKADKRGVLTENRDARVHRREMHHNKKAHVYVHMRLIEVSLSG